MVIVARKCTEIIPGFIEENQAPKSLQLEEFRATSAYVLLGDPGMGKTTSFETESADLEPEAIFLPARDFLAMNLVLQRRFKEGCPRRHEARLGAWHESGWPVRYCPAYPPATAATLQVRTVPGAASHALPGTLGAGLSGASFPPQACCRLRRKAPPSRHRATW